MLLNFFNDIINGKPVKAETIPETNIITFNKTA